MTPPHVTTEPVSNDVAGRSGDARIRLRNYDHRRGHSIRVVADGRGTTTTSVRRYLAPGQSAEIDGIDVAGAATLCVSVDGIERERTVCRLDDPRETTVDVEVGNGIASVWTGRSSRADAD